MQVCNSRSVLALLFLTILGVSQSSFASNVGGVFGPGVREGDQSAEYRMGYDPDSYATVQRIHYQQSLNDDVRLRGVFQGRKTDNSDFDYDFFQGELQWQLEGSDTHQHALRFDVRVRDRGRKGHFGVNWTNQFKLSPRLSARAILLSYAEIGSNAESGVFFQTRASMNYKTDGPLSLSAEWFSEYGSSSDFKSFDDQIHQVGPAVSGKFADDWSFFSGVLLGATDASPDTSLRLWITKRFN